MTHQYINVGILIYKISFVKKVIMKMKNYLSNDGVKKNIGICSQMINHPNL